MTNDTLDACIDIMRKATTSAFNHGRRMESRDLGFVFHALLRERAAQFDQCGERGSSPVLPHQGYPHPTEAHVGE